MNKTVLAVSVLLAAVSLAAFANGTGETAGETRPWGEPVTLTGTLDLQQANAFPRLKTGSGTWDLMVPRLYGLDVPVKNGDSITVSGFEVPGPRWNRQDGQRALMVQKAEIAGKEYILLRGHGPYRMRAPNGAPGRFGMMDRRGYGPGRGPSAGPRGYGRRGSAYGGWGW